MVGGVGMPHGNRSCGLTEGGIRRGLAIPIPSVEGHGKVVADDSLAREQREWGADRPPRNRDSLAIRRPAHPASLMAKQDEFPIPVGANHMRVGFAADHAGFPEQQSCVQMGLPAMRREQIQAGGSAQLGGTAIAKRDSIARGDDGSIAKDGRTLQGRPVDRDRLERLHEVVFANSSHDEGAAAQIAPDGEVDVIAGKRLPECDFVGIAHCKAPDAIDPKNRELVHGGLGTRGGKKTSKVTHHNVDPLLKATPEDEQSLDALGRWTQATRSSRSIAQGALDGSTCRGIAKEKAADGFPLPW